jgi:metallo-beta-lactamase class B
MVAQGDSRPEWARPYNGRMMRRSLLLLLAAGLAVPAAAQSNPTWRSWNQPVAPFRILGNVYYVGTNELACFLITTPRGHFLLDAGFEETAPLIEDSIRALGFRVEDVRYLLNSQAHIDHAGGLATLQRKSGATLVASAGDAPVIAGGGKGDFRFEGEHAWPPARVDRVVKDGEGLELGGVTVTAHLTPGHTRGCTTWALTAEEGKERYAVVFAGSLSVLPGVRLVGNPKYPGIAADFEQSIRMLRALPCDVFLSAHAGFFDMQGKRERLAAHPKRNPFVDPEGYREYLDHSDAAFRKRLEQETRSERQGVVVE